MKSISEANVRDTDRPAENKIQAETQIPMTYRALEPRIAFDAAMAETIDQTTDAPAPAPASTSADVPVLLPSDIRILADLLACGSAAAPAGGGPIVFIDAAVNDPAVIASAAPEGGEIVVLEAGRDGVEQIAAHLAGRHGVDAVHIVSHGTAGELRLGSATLDQQSLSGAHADAMAVIRAALSAEADILLYGCDVAAGSTGEAFVAALASATGADVAASSDDTGAAARGGDWDLETRLGLIEAGLIDAPEWNGLLAPLNISATTSPVVRDNTGAVVSVTAHDANFLTVAVGTAGSTNVHITDPAKMVGATVIWANAGFVGGTAIDLRATVLSVIDTNPNANQPATLNFAINGDDPSVRIENAEVRLRWDAFAAGTYNPATGAGTVARGDVGFFIRDIDAQGNLYAFPGGVKTETYHNLTGVKPQESVRADLDELDRYTTESAATTHLTVGLNVDPDTGATVTDP